MLLVVLIIGPGFFSKDDTMDESEVLTFIPLMATDSTRSGGGTPQPPTPAPTVAQPETPTPTPPTPSVVEPVRQPDPPRPVEPRVEKPAPEKPSKPDRDSLDPKLDKPKKHEVTVNKKVVTIPSARRKSNNSSSTTETNAKESAERERAAANAKLFANAGKRISSNLAPSTQVDMPDGPGGGGVSYAPYAQIVRAKYTEAWRIPDDVTDDEAVVKVSVTIARDGSVISSRIITESGSKLVDRSIQNALDRVTTIGVAFPAGAKESQRTFTISFSLKAKKLLG